MWRGIGDISVGMARQGYDLQLTRYDQPGRREMVRQNELTVQPLLVTRIERQEGDDLLVIRNIGRGPGLFVRVPEIEITVEGGVRFVARCDAVDVIEAGEAVVAPIHVWTED